MKKLFRGPVAAVLAILLAAAFWPCSAFADTPAAVSGSETGASASDEYNADAPWLYYNMTEEEYYEEFEPWRAEGLTEEEYYGGSEDKPWLYYDMTEEEYYEEFEPWRATGQTEEEYYDEYYARLREESRVSLLLELGFTDTDSPNVLINGQALNFEDAKPLARGGATMVPARAALAALGADVSYDGKAKTMTVVSDDVTVVFTVGARAASVTRGGLTKEIELDEAPFIEGGAAYVPLRALAEGFDLDVYWNNYYKVAELVDKNALIAEIDGGFTVLNALLQSEASGMFMNPFAAAPHRTNVNFTAGLKADWTDEYSYYEELKGDAKLDGAFSVLSDGNGLDASGDVKLEVNGFEAFLGEIEEDPELKEIVAALGKGVPFEMILNYADAVTYFKLPLLAEIGLIRDKNAWIEARGADAGFDIEAARAAADAMAGIEELTVGNLLYWDAYEQSDPDSDYDYSYYSTYYSDFNRYESLISTARALAPFLGDAYMEKKGDVHTISLNRLELFNILRKPGGELGGVSFGYYDDYAEFLAAVPVANYTLHITEKDGAFDSMDIAANVKLKLDTYYDEEPIYVEFHCDAAAAARDVTLDYDVSVSGAQGTGALTLHMDAASEPADKTPRTAPPAGATIIPSDEL
jgi:hypothetical protein